MSRFRSISAWIMQLLLALLFLVQGAMKLAGSPHWISRFRAWGYPEHFYLLVGAAELLGAVLLLIPRLVRFGALVLMAVMMGAAATHLTHHEPQLATALILIILLGIVFYLRGGPAVRPKSRANV
jgi:putative oxidoreductase